MRLDKHLLQALQHHRTRVTGQAACLNMATMPCRYTITRLELCASGKQKDRCPLLFAITESAEGATSKMSAASMTASRFNPHIELDRFSPRPRVGGDTRSMSRPGPMPCFNPRPPRGGRPPHGDGRCARQRVSIHAPRVGVDAPTLTQAGLLEVFQSTPPAWGATCARPTDGSAGIRERW